MLRRDGYQGSDQPTPPRPEGPGANIPMPDSHEGYAWKDVYDDSDPPVFLGRFMVPADG